MSLLVKYIKFYTKLLDEIPHSDKNKRQKMRAIAIPKILCYFIIDR